MGPRSKPVEKLVEECISGRTPHLDAVVERLPDVDPQLIYKLSMEIKSNRGNTIIHMGSRRGETDAIRQVLDMLSATQRFQLLKQKNDWGRTALHHAVMHSQEETAIMELEMVEPVIRLELLQMQDQKGCTALHHTAEKGLMGVINALMDVLSLDEFVKLLQTPNHEGSSALNVAHDYNRVQVAEYLSSMLDNQTVDLSSSGTETQQFDEVCRRVETNERAIEKLQEKIIVQDECISGLHTGIRENANTIHELKSHNEEQKSQIEELKSQNEEIKKSAAELAEQNKALLDEFEEQKQRMAHSLAEQKARMKENFEKNRCAINDLGNYCRSEIDSQAIKNQEHDNKLKDLEDEIEFPKGKVQHPAGSD